MTQYTVTISTPGNLPEAEPATFDTLDEARVYVASEIERDWEDEYQAAMDDRDQRTVNGRYLEIDGRYLDAHTQANLMGANDSLTVEGPGPHSLGRVYEVHATQTRYARIVFQQGDDADETLSIIEQRGEQAGLDHLTQWDNDSDPYAYEISDYIPAGAHDLSYERGDYILSYNPGLQYAGLVRQFTE